MNAAQVVEQLKQRFPNEPEYIQAVSQVLPISSTTTPLARTKAVSVITRA